MSVKLSAVIVTLNEEKNLGACLDALKGVVDEVVIVDSFSTDTTAQIAKDSGAVFIQKEWEGYAATKNYANQQASYDHILSLDADEVLSDELKTSIEALHSNDLEKAYAMNRLNNYCGLWVKYAGWYPDRKIRLFDRRRSHWEGDLVHEELKTSQDIARLSGDLLHYTYYSKQEHIDRERKYARLAAASDRNPLAIKALASMCFRFVKMYIFKGGFLHGKRGLQLCQISARSKWWRYQYARN